MTQQIGRQADSFTIAVAQSSSSKGDIDENVRRHLMMVARAIENDVNVIVFPELSLTGYEPEIAAQLAIDASDHRLNPLQELSDRSGVTIVAGCPIRSNFNKPYIGALIFRRHLKIETYRKRFVHEDELPWFLPSDDVVVCASHGRHLGIAICFDVSNPQHAADTFRKGADVYVAGVAKTPDGIAKAEEQLAGYARRHQSPVVMANHATETGGSPTGGRSAIWNEFGNIIIRAPESSEHLAIAERSPDEWKGRIVAMGNSSR